MRAVNDNRTIMDEFVDERLPKIPTETRIPLGVLGFLKADNCLSHHLGCEFKRGIRAARPLGCLAQTREGRDALAKASFAGTVEVSDSSMRILVAANDVYNENPVLPLPLSLVAERAGVSRALIYARFPDQFDLIHALLLTHLDLIGPPIEKALAEAASFETAVDAVGSLLFEHFVEHGLLLANATQDDFLRNRLPPAMEAALQRSIRKLAWKGCRQFGFTHRQSIAALVMIAVIPEQAARLVRRKAIDLETGRSSLTRSLKLAVQTFRSD